MPAKRSNADILLQKVNSQLRGERVPLKNKDENELDTYLNSLTQKTQQKRSVNFEEYGDLSISSITDAKNTGRHVDEPVSGLVSPTLAPASRFLKKKTSVVAISQSLERKGTSAPQQVRSDQNSETLAKSTHRPGINKVLSNESESEISPRRSDVGKSPGSADTAVERNRVKFLKSQRAVFEDDRPALRSPSPQTKKTDKKTDLQNGAKHKDEILRTLGSQFMSSDQDSLAEFIQGLSTSESSGRRPPNLITKKHQKWRKRTSPSESQSPSPVRGSRSPSPFKRSKSPFGKFSGSMSQDSDLMDFMDSEILEVRQGSGSEDNFKIYHVDVASLLTNSPSPPPKKVVENITKEIHKPNKFSASSSSKLKEKTTKVANKTEAKKSESKSSLFDTWGIYMVDELLDFTADSNKDGNEDISEESEIKTESSSKQKKKLQSQPSISEILTNIGEEIVPDKNSSVEESERRGSPDEDVTQVDEYTDTFDTESKTISQCASEKSRDRVKSKSKEHLSQNNSHRHSRKGRKHKILMEEMLVDVSAADGKGGTRYWNTTHTNISVSGPYGLQYVDPAPIATQVVSADALEVLTAYSPNMLALQEMLKAQLQLIQNFVDIQQRIYKSFMDGLRCDYKYTTLEDTKEYIKKHRKPRMTMEEALRLVELEN